MSTADMIHDHPGLIALTGDDLLAEAPIAGEKLVAVNGVRFPEPLVIETVDMRPLAMGPFEPDEEYPEITVHMGGEMISLTLSPTTVVLVELSDPAMAADLRASGFGLDAPAEDDEQVTAQVVSLMGGTGSGKTVGVQVPYSLQRPHQERNEADEVQHLRGLYWPCGCLRNEAGAHRGGCPAVGATHGAAVESEDGTRTVVMPPTFDLPTEGSRFLVMEPGLVHVDGRLVVASRGASLIRSAPSRTDAARLHHRDEVEP